MKNLQSYDEFINESKLAWEPGGKYLSSVFVDSTELGDESAIAQFVEFHNLPKMVIDVCKYAKSELKLIPSKITTGGMVFSGKGGTKIEIEFNKGELILWHFRMEWDGKDMKNHLLRNRKFSYLEFKNMVK